MRSIVGVTAAVLALSCLSPALSLADGTPQATAPEVKAQPVQNGSPYQGPYWYPDWLWGAPSDREGGAVGVPPDGRKLELRLDKPPAYPQPVPLARPNLGEIGKKPVSLDVTRTEAAEAVLNLLSAAGASYVIGRDVPTGRKVTAKLKNVPLEEALEALAEAAGLTYTIRGRVIILRPAGVVSLPMAEIPPIQLQPMKPAPKAPGPPSPFKLEPKAEAEKSRTSARIELRHVSPTEILKRLGVQAAPEPILLGRPERQDSRSEAGQVPPIPLPQGLDLLRAEEPNAVIASGSEEAVRNVEQLLRQLDTQPDQIRISTSVLSVSASALDAVRRRMRMPSPPVIGGPQSGITTESLDPASADRFLEALKASGAIVLAQPSIVSINNLPASVEVSGGGRPGGNVSLMVQPRINADRSVTLNLSFGAAQAALPSGPAGMPMEAPGGPQVVQRLEPGKVLVLTQPALAGRSDRRMVLFVRTNVLPGGSSEKGIDRKAVP